MKILTTSQIREADAYTIEHEPISSVNLMERAATALTSWFTVNYSTKKRIKIFCGPGNNGGDGLALGRLLSEKGFNPDLYILTSRSGYSPDTSINLERLRALNINPQVIVSKEDFPPIDPLSVTVDALFGTGLTRPVEGLPADLINHINRYSREIVSIDIPSGLFGDDNRNNTGKSIITANKTLSFQFPKLAFMFTENNKYTGHWEILDISLHQDYIKSAMTNYLYTTQSSVSPLIKKRDKFSHKGTFGHCLLISGSYGKMGAAVLAAKSCLRTGCGLLTVHVPKKGCEILQISAPESMISTDRSDKYFTDVPEIKNYSAIGAGPALGTKPETEKALLNLLKQSDRPLILDADAINIIASNRDWLGQIPANSVLTPHPGEFDRLAGEHRSGHDRLVSQIAMAMKHKLVIVLKGAFSSVATPEGNCYFNSTGNPGMATGGSGDVLTGILLSLLGQGYTPVDAAITGVYLHGLAGDISANEESAEAMIAGDLIKNLGKAFKLTKY